jgi:opacity protein-like surface antigen
MKSKLFIAALALLVCAVAAAAQTPQEKEATRNATREKLRQLLAASGPKKGIGIDFRQSEKNPFNFVGVKRDGLTNTDFIEVVVGVSDNETIGFRIYPHYKGGYVNLGRAKDGVGLMRALLRQSNTNFLYWGADTTDDIFAGYTFTLESGFPDKAIEIVLYSIAPLDGFVGQMRPFVDGSAAPPAPPQ